MIALGIDTTATTCSVALYEDALLASRTVTNGPTHSTTLLPFIKEVLEEKGLDLSQIGLIAVSVGPGSFTGLRIGISAVKGLAFSGSIPCAPVSTLHALAENACEKEGVVICPVMDARRGEFYNALFKIEGNMANRLTDDRAISGEVLKEELKKYKNLLILGDGAEKFVETYPEFAPFLAAEEIRFQKGESVARIGLRMSENSDLVTCQSLSPVYLRLPQAEREWLLKNKQN